MCVLLSRPIVNHHMRPQLMSRSVSSTPARLQSKMWILALGKKALGPL